MPRVVKDPKTTAIPNNIGDLRSAHALTMKEVAEKVGIPLGSYGVIESGHSLPNRRILDTLCGVFQCDPSDLYDDYVVWVITTEDRRTGQWQRQE